MPTFVSERRAYLEAQGVVPEALTLLLRQTVLTEQPQPPLGAWLAAARKRKRYSARELAQAAGLSAGYVSLIENGYDPRTNKRLEPSPKVLRMLAAALSEGDAIQEAEYYRAMMRETGYLPREMFPELDGPVEATDPTPTDSLTPNALQLATDLINAVLQLPDSRAARLRELLDEREMAEVDITRERGIVEREL